MVARGIVFSGFATLPDGMVAHSIPKKAKKVNVAVAPRAAIVEVGPALKGIKFSACKKNSPPTDTSNNGIIFRMVVINCSLPDVTIPKVLIQVRNQMAPNPVSTAAINHHHSKNNSIIAGVRWRAVFFTC